MKIRVLHILDELNTGGAERIVFSYFQHIDREKFQWDFVMTRYADPNKKGILEDEIEMLGGKIYRVHRKRENYIQNIKDVDEIIKYGNYQVVHSHLDELSSFYLLSAKRHGVPVRIAHSHLAGANRGFLVETLCVLLKPILKCCATSKFACGKDAGICLWGTKSLKNEEIYVMHNAIDTSLFSFNSDIRKRKRSELNIGDSVVFGTVGRMSYQKNSEFIVEIFNEIHTINPMSKMIFVGTGENESNVKSMARNYNLTDHIIFLDSRNDVNELMMAMDVFLLPSRFEGLPIVLVEAQCTGLECVVSDSVTDEIRINSNVHYYGLEHSAKEWAYYILSISDDYDRTKGEHSISQAGYKIDQEAKKLESHYLQEVKRCTL